MNKEELNQKIQVLEQNIYNTKQSLKSWANQISQHHKALKEISNQLNSLKTKLK